MRKKEDVRINKEKIEIWTEASDPQNDVLTYLYHITGGEIIGEGKKVIWDLSDVKPGEYKITAGVNDGCGVCGQTKTRVVYVVECPKVSGEGYPPGIIYSLQLDKTEVIEMCPLPKKRGKKRKSCSNDNNLVKVSTASSNLPGSKAIYKYEVTGGQIIGNGENVEWDLSEAVPGTYVITANVDIGSGFCSQPKSQVVTVVECSKCKKEK